jgi:CRP-like cAMP-binding protein
MLAQWTINVARRAAQARLSHLLCEMALRFERIGAGDRRVFRFEVTQVQFGEILGLTSVHVNRTFRALREAGVITVRGRDIGITDWDQLVRLADFDPAYLQLNAVEAETA